jgi:hypothetical protein
LEQALEWGLEQALASVLEQASGLEWESASVLEQASALEWVSE